MARVAGTALLRSVASRVARAPPPPHRLLALRLYGGRPEPRPELPAGMRISSTPPPPPPPPPINKGLLSVPPLNELGRHSIMRATISAAPFLVFGMIMCGWVNRIMEDFRENFEAASKERSEMKEEIIQSITDEFQKIRDLLEHSKELVK